MKHPVLVTPLVLLVSGCASMGQVGTCTPSSSASAYSYHRPDTEFRTINSNHGPVYIFRQGNTYWVNDKRTRR